MTNKKALDIVLGMARELNIDADAKGNPLLAERYRKLGTEEIEALAQMEDYYNDVLEN